MSPSRRFIGLALNALKDFFTVNGDILGRGNAKTDLIAFHIEHGNRDGVPDRDAFSDTTGED